MAKPTTRREKHEYNPSKVCATAFSSLPRNHKSDEIMTDLWSCIDVFQSFNPKQITSNEWKLLQYQSMLSFKKLMETVFVVKVKQTNLLKRSFENLAEREKIIEKKLKEFAVIKNALQGKALI